MLYGYQHTNLIKYLQCLFNELFMCTYLKTNCMLLFVGINNTFGSSTKIYMHCFFHMELCEYVTNLGVLWPDPHKILI